MPSRTSTRRKDSKSAGQATLTTERSFVKPGMRLAEISEDGVLIKGHPKIRVWRISTGIYQLEFLGLKSVGQVLVSIDRKPRGRRYYALVRSLPLYRMAGGDLRKVEIAMRDAKGNLKDKAFLVMALGEDI